MENRQECVSLYDEARDALDHIIRVSAGSRNQSRRIRWISQRAQSALNGDQEWREIDLPKNVNTEAKRNRRLNDDNRQLREIHEEDKKTIADLTAEIERLKKVIKNV